MSDKTGGPAFPVTGRSIQKYGDEQGYIRTKELYGPIGGMTMLDHFAGLAMQGMMANDADGYTFYSLSQASYEMATAMLRARADYLEGDHEN